MVNVTIYSIHGSYGISQVFWLANISGPSILQSHAEGGLQHAIIQASSNDTGTQAAVH
jgi:hypothetical protein